MTMILVLQRKALFMREAIENRIFFKNL